MRQCSGVCDQCRHRSIEYGLSHFSFVEFVVTVFIVDLVDAFNVVIIPCIHDVDVIIFPRQIYLHINYHLLQPRLANTAVSTLGDFECLVTVMCLVSCCGL